MDSLARVYGGIYTQMDRLNLIQEHVLSEEILEWMLDIILISVISSGASNLTPNQVWLL